MVTITELIPTPRPKKIPKDKHSFQANLPPDDLIPAAKHDTLHIVNLENGPWPPQCDIIIHSFPDGHISAQITWCYCFCEWPSLGVERDCSSIGGADLGRQGKHFHTVSLLLPRAIPKLPQLGFKCTKLQFRRHPASHRPVLQTTGATFTLQKSQVNIFVWERELILSTQFHC